VLTQDIFNIQTNACFSLANICN